jgi:hypothetical protein
LGAYWTTTVVVGCVVALTVISVSRRRSQSIFDVARTDSNANCGLRIGRYGVSVVPRRRREVAREADELRLNTWHGRHGSW